MMDRSRQATISPLSESRLLTHSERHGAADISGERYQNLLYFNCTGYLSPEVSRYIAVRTSVRGGQSTRFNYYSRTSMARTPLGP